MAHSVERHLAVTPKEYDVEIRKFIPAYDAMLDEVAGALAEHFEGAAHVVDLGAGTGGLTERIAQKLPAVRLTLVDADAAMLARARERLAPVGDRIALVEGSFTEPLPSCDAAVAAFALHHVHDPAQKLELYRNIHRAAGRLLVIADAMVPEKGPFTAAIYERWAAHLVTHGDTRAQAMARFADWAKEDRYFGIDVEIDRLRAAGFASVDVRWRLGPVAVVVASKA
jgi:tRNA (cmo5U34)-methyltransferase